MSLHDKLKKVKDKSEEKTVALRIPKSKAMILEKLAAYYDLNISALIREMMDDSIMKLQKDLIVFPDELGVKVKVNEKDKLITYFPDIVAFYTDDSYPYHFTIEDCNCDKTLLDKKVIEDAKLSVEKGLSMSASGIAPVSKKEYYFIKKGEK